jgi:hypothetical protein
MYDVPPTREVWESRLLWLQREEEAAQHPLGSYFVQEQACALSMDLYVAFCSGAWISVLVMAHAIADAALRGEDTKSRPCDVFGTDADLTWLRKRRNKLVHACNASPTITVDGMWANQSALEADAKRAVHIMFRTLFSDVGT